MLEVEREGVRQLFAALQRLHDPLAAQGKGAEVGKIDDKMVKAEAIDFGEAAEEGEVGLRPQGHQAVAMLDAVAFVAIRGHRGIRLEVAQADARGEEGDVGIDDQA